MFEMTDVLEKEVAGTERLISTAQYFLEISVRLGIKYIFANLGSDHPAFIEAFAALREQGRECPHVIVCPHEMTALSAAHGYAMVTREPQLVLVHVDVGTQNLGGSVHNVARGRIPVIIVAGLSPVTDAGERIGSRNEFIHFIQDTSRQHEIVAQYMKWSYELRAPEMVDKILFRGWQIAMSSPEGPVYITAAREVWEAKIPPWRGPGGDTTFEQAKVPPCRGIGGDPAQLGGLPGAGLQELFEALCLAKRPIIMTSYLGRQPEAVALLTALSEKLGFGVCEIAPQYLNFPGDHPHHLGYQPDNIVIQADLIILLDIDVPWIPSKIQFSEGTRIFHIDIDPLKPSLGFWYFPACRCFQADSLRVLEQLTVIFDAAGNQTAMSDGYEQRLAWLTAVKESNLTQITPITGLPADGPITVEELTEAVRQLITARTIVLFEAPSAIRLAPSILRLNRPGSYFFSGGSALGWAPNAAIGVKLADPDAEVIALVGDGTFKYAVPSSAYWVSGTYGAPFLTIIYNNGGWNSPKYSTLLLHPDGAAKRNDTYWVTTSSDACLADIAAASGNAAAFRITERSELEKILKNALQTVQEGRSAVVDVMIAPISRQLLG